MSFRSLLLAGALALASIAGAADAFAENRIALVIGNSAYQSVPQLSNPSNDAKRMAELLTSAGFEVMAAHDLGQSEMRRTIGEFARKAAAKGPDTVALVYYGGHGLQVDGDNYLVPTDAAIKQEADVPLQTLRLADLMNALAAAPSKTRIVMLDACRNNPFSELNKTSGRGLAIVDAPNGSIISYATAPGSEAEDGEGRNSPYASAFLAVAREPGLPIEQAFKRVRYAVHQATDGRQTPWESSSLTGDFSFFPGGAETTGAASAAAPGPQVASLGAGAITRSAEGWQEELRAKSPREAYEIVIREDALEAYQAFLELYPSESFAPRVRSLLERRQELVAWHEAVTINTPAAYREFLASYPKSDYAAAAQRLVSRTDSRSLGAEARARACGPTRTRRTDSGAGQRRASLDDDAGPRPALAAPVAIETPGFERLPLLVRPPLFGRPHGLRPIVEKPHLQPPHLQPPLDKPKLDKPKLETPHIRHPLDGKTFEKPHVVKPVIRPVLEKPAIKPRLDRPRFVNRTPGMMKPQIMAKPVFARPKLMSAPVRTTSFRPMGGGGMGGGMRFGGGGFGRFR